MKVEQEIRRFVQAVADASPDPPLVNPSSSVGRRATPVAAVAGGFVAALVIVGAGAVWMLADNTSPPTGQSFSIPVEVEAALTPQEILADGVVTETEYRGAVRAVVACLDELGFDTVVRYDSTGVAAFSSYGEGVAEFFDPCFNEHLGSVALSWAGQNTQPEEEIAFYNDVVDCVESQTGESYGDVEAVGDTRATDAAIADAPGIYRTCFDEIIPLDGLGPP